MKYLIKNTRGVTLVEVAAVIVIASIVATLIFGIAKSSVEQKEQQTQQTHDLFDVTYALKVVTKDIRRSTNAIPVTSELVLTFPETSPYTFREVIYSLEDGQLKKKTTDTVSGVEKETIETILDGIGCARFTSTATNIVSIELSNTSVCSEGKKTEIHLREGS